MGLENVIKFVVGLSPATESQVNQLCTLCVIERKKVNDPFHVTATGLLLNFLRTVSSYEIELLRECDSDSAKLRILTEALINAPVITVSPTRIFVGQRGAELLGYFTEEQSREFLRKVYGCVLKPNPVGGVTMCRNNTHGDEGFHCDDYVVGFLQKFPCTALEVGRVVAVDTNIPVDLLPLLTSGVSEVLYIESCILLCGRNNAGRCDTVSVKTQSASPTLTVHVKLANVSGLRQLRECDVTLPTVRGLSLTGCRDVDICQLSCTFTQLRQLEVDLFNCTLVYGADFRSLHGMRALNLTNCEVKLREWKQLCPQLTVLSIERFNGCYSPLSWADVGQWQSLQTLSLAGCGTVSLCQCRQQCPNLRHLQIWDCLACVDDVDSPWWLLQTLKLETIFTIPYVRDITCLVRRRMRLTKEEAIQTLKDICPSARIFFDWQLPPGKLVRRVYSKV